MHQILQLKHVYIRLKMNLEDLLHFDLENYQNSRKNMRFIIKNFLQ